MSEPRSGQSVQFMNEDLIIYYHHNVVAVYEEYRCVSADNVYGMRRDLRKAIDAATALFHFREHLPKLIALTRTQAEAACTDYGLLGDAVNSAKHKTIGNSTPHGPPLVRDFESILEQKVVIHFQDEKGEYSVSLKIVVVQLEANGERVLLDVLTNVLNFWEQYLFTKGVLEKKRVFQYQDPFRKRSREECKTSSTGIAMTQGLPAQLQFRLLRFDNKQNRAVQIDLTGAKLVFRVFRPKPVEIVIAVKRTVDGRVFERTVELSVDETFQLSTCSSEESKNEFLSGLPQIQKALGDLGTEIKELQS